jgi:hypothetical protein
MEQNRVAAGVSAPQRQHAGRELDVREGRCEKKAAKVEREYSGSTRSFNEGRDLSTRVLVGDDGCGRNANR